MKESQFNSIYNGLTSLSKKVYEATPINEQWGLSQIHSEMMRKGINNQKSAVSGALHDMVRRGIIKAVGADSFIRVVVEKAKENVPELIERKVQTINKEGGKDDTAPTLRPIDLITGLSNMATELMSHANILQNAIAGFKDKVEGLNSEIDRVAILVEDQFNYEDEETQKLKQLKDLIKNL